MSTPKVRKKEQKNRGGGGREMAPSSTVSLKLLIDNRSNRVLFGEAGKEFIDFLFNLFSLPLGTVNKLLTEQGMVGSLDNLYHSVENLSEIYLQPGQTKQGILEPRVIRSSGRNPPLLLLPDAKPAQLDSETFYRCHSSYCSYIAKEPGLKCPSCGYPMDNKMTLAKPPLGTGGLVAASEGGFVKGLVTYMVMDDLAVQPMSSISSITLLNKFGVTEVGALEERNFDLTMHEGLKLLKASLRSKTVLTDVFLKKNRTK